MKKRLFYENGEPVPHEEMAILVLQSVQEWRDQRKKELVDKIKNFVNTRATCTDFEAKMLIDVIGNHNKNVPFGN